MAIVCSAFITIIDMNDITSSETAPSTPVEGTLWLDTSVTPPVLKVWQNGEWKIVDDEATGTTNLLKNTGLRKDTTGWSLSGGVTLDRTVKKGNNNTFKYNITGLTSDSWRSANPNNVEVDIFKRYSAACEVKIPTNHGIDQGASLEVQWFDASGTRVGTNRKEVDVTITGRWQRVKLERLRVPSNAVKANARVWAKRNGTFHVAELFFTEGAKVGSWVAHVDDIKGEVEDSVQDAIISQTQEEIFNKLTNNGQSQGIFMDDEKNFYINGEYIRAENLSVVRHSDKKTTLKVTSDGNIEINASKLSIQSSGVATQTDVSNAVDSIEVGGRNIACETNQGTKNWNWAFQTGGATKSQVIENGIKSCQFVRNSTTAPGWNYISYANIGRDKYLPSKKYTVSFEVKASVATAFYISLKEGDGTDSLTNEVKTGNTVANKWTKLSVTLTTVSTLPTSTAQVLYLTGMNVNTGVSYIFRNLMIEEGTKASSWSPAVEDLQNAYTVFLSNEAQVIPTDTARFPLASKTYTTNITVYQGATQRTDFTIGTIANSNEITVSKSASSVSFAVNQSRALTVDDGVFSIPITIDGKTFSKVFSWACSKQGITGNTGATGATGATGPKGDNAKNASIIPSTQVFKSVDGGVTFAPSTITLTPTLQNVTFSKWMYSIDGGTNWNNVTSGSNGLTLSGNVLKIANNSSLYNSSITSVVFKLITNDSAVTDTMTIVKLYDITELEVGGTNLIRKSALRMSSTTGTFDESTNTWTLTAEAGSGGNWGSGLSITGSSSIGYVKIPYGRTYVLSFEIKVPRECQWNLDVNNYAVTGTPWNGNDNDNGSNRKTSSKTLKPNQWVKCWSRIENTLSGNTDKVDIYDCSNFGVLMKDETSPMTFQIRNVQGELGHFPTEWSPNAEDVQANIDEASKLAEQAQSTANTAKTEAANATAKLNDIANDSKLTALEKQQIARDWEEIQLEKPSIVTQANVYSVSVTNFNSAYTALESYVATLKLTESSTITIVKDTFKSKFNTYYKQRQVVLDQIAAKTKEYANQLVADISIGGTNLMRYSSAEYLSDSEISEKWMCDRGILKVQKFDSDTNAYFGFKKVFWLSYTKSDSHSNSWANLQEGVTDKIIPFVPGEKYTLSFKSYVGVRSKGISFVLFNSNGTNIKTIYAYTKPTENYGSGIFHEKSVTFTAPNESGYLCIYNLGYETADATGECNLLFNEIQIEKGTKSSDWSPNPKDTIDSVSEVSSALSSFENTVNHSFKDGIIQQAEAKAIAQNINALNAEKSDIDKEYEILYKNSHLIGNAKTNLKSAKDSFNSSHASLISTINTAISDGKVSASESASVQSTFGTYNGVLATYKQRVQEALDNISTSKVNGIKIGGTNLLRNTKAPSDLSHWVSGTGFSVAQSELLGENVFKLVSTASGTERYASTKHYKVEANTQYTFSMDVYMDANVESLDIFWLSRAKGVTESYKNVTHFVQSWKTTKSKWVRIIGTFTTKSDDYEGFIRIDNNGTTNASTLNGLWFTKVQLEKGNVVTEWSLSPEDIKGSISDVQTNLSSFQSTVNGAFKDGLVQEAEAKAIAQHLQTLESTRVNVIRDYNSIYTNTSLSGTPKSNLLTAKTEFESAHKSLVSTINTVISDGKVTSTESASVKSTFTTYDGKLGTLKERLQQALDAISSTKVGNVQIGGTNLVQNSAPTSGLWSTSTNWSCSLVECTSAPYGKAMRATFNGTTDVTTTTSGGMHRSPVSRDKFVGGETYTISAYIRASQNKKIGFYNEMMTTGNTINVTTEWQKYTFTSTINTSAQYHSNIFYVRESTSVGEWIEVHSLKLEKGNKASEWSPALDDMQNAYTILLTNEAQTIPTNPNRVPSSSTTYYTDIQVYQGTTKRTDYTIGAISSANGITVSKTTTRVNFAVSTGTALTTDGGSFTIPITIDGKTFNKTFSWSASKQGATGATGANGTNGVDGKGIKSITEYYLASSSSSGVTTSTSGWSTSMKATTTTNKYLWNYEIITYTDNSTSIVSPRIIGTHGATGSTGATGATGNGISSITNYYLATSSNSNVTTSTSGWTTGVQSVTASKKYLWNYESIAFTNGSVSTTTPTIIGAYGDKGDSGTNASVLDLTASSSSFTSRDGGETLTPSSILVTANTQNATIKQWQISADGGNTWENLSNGTNKTLTIQHSSFSNRNTNTLVVRCISTNSSVYDTVTLHKIIGYEDAKFGMRNLYQNSTEEWVTFSGFSNISNQCILAHKVLTKGLKVGDKVSIRIKFKFNNIKKSTTNTSGTTVRFQGSGNVTSWNSGTFNGGSFPITFDTANHEAEFTSSFKVDAEMIKNEYWDTNLRFDYIASGEVSISSQMVVNGTLPTSWFPAPEDISGYVDENFQSLLDRNNETMAKIDKITSDDHISESERADFNSAYKQAQSQYTSMDDTYNALNLPHLNASKELLKNAYNNLKTVVERVINGNLETGAVSVRNAFEQYYVEYNKSLYEISAYTGKELTHVTSKIEQYDGKIELAITSANKAEAATVSMGKHIQFDNNWLELYGTINGHKSQFKTRISNERMSFYDYDDEVAYISHKKLNIENATIRNTLGVGNVAMKPSSRENGGIVFAYDLTLNDLALAYSLNETMIRQIEEQDVNVGIEIPIE